MVWDEIPGQKIIEPVEIESLRSYLGFSDERTEEDDFLESIIKSARSRIEDRLGRAIPRRTFTKHVYEPGMHYLIPSLVDVKSIGYVTLADVTSEIEGFRVWKGDAARVFFEAPADADVEQGFIVTFESGFTVCPESLKMAILKVCKFDQDRSAEDAIEAVSTDIQIYRVENI